MIYILIMNVIGFCLMGLDKHRARTRQWRVPEKILFGAALLGGSAGACRSCAGRGSGTEAVTGMRGKRRVLPTLHPAMSHGKHAGGHSAAPDVDGEGTS